MFDGRGCILLFCVALLSAPLFGQEPSNVGGKWTRTDGLDPASPIKVVFFTLPADEAELGRSPSIQLECTGDGKFLRARYFADAVLLVKDADYANYRAPAIIPKLRIDKKNSKAIWDVLPDQKSAELDKKTLRALFRATDLQVRYTDKMYNNFTDIYTVSGLNRREVAKACGEQKWLAATGP